MGLPDDVGMQCDSHDERLPRRLRLLELLLERIIRNPGDQTGTRLFGHQLKPV